MERIIFTTEASVESIERGKKHAYKPSTGIKPEGDSQMNLKPCPFCGGNAEYERQGTSRQSCIITCEDCGCRLESNEVDTTQGNNWNERVRDNERDSLIVDQQLLIRQYQSKLKEYNDIFTNIRGRLVCCGGPLNDNFLGYTFEQQKIFHYIFNLVREEGEDESDSD